MIYVKYRDIEALDFIATRLLTFSRVSFDLLLETVERKFGVSDAQELAEVLLLAQAVTLENDHLGVLNRKTLKHFSLIHSCCVVELNLELIRKPI